MSEKCSDPGTVELWWNGTILCRDIGSACARDNGRDLTHHGDKHTLVMGLLPL